MPDAPAHRFPVRVYFEDTDAGGVVYHAAYLRFAERARTEWLRDLGLAHSQLIAREGLIFVVKRLAIDYVRPARLDESLVVETRLAGLGRASVTLAQTVRRAEATVAALEVVLACVRLATGRPEAMPEGLRGLIRAQSGV
ncbi:tol-pal system-associated acyl-CoA thioesterase [Elioraea thermophila]|uniref:tol-pal system-associated acyl-CoA thioesterase n=1 Tax=Elioraea thermophila TaxID=2185104 RepID=UPI000DF1D38E|nr:tol-pal system-associated acyl-CoA thioesterase [Elioraea thermophila]